MLYGDGKCPKCEKDVTHLEIKDTHWGESVSGPKYPTILGCCPHCKTVITASISPDFLTDQVARKTAILILGEDELEARLQARERPW